ncbi:hypothetical protein F5Y19DRAFT_25811 [Xylariaceae sp. FL1651]|nr:hypothetical protein F5Y19DRAFT_25811 [Xylariaceae sp. FL1651]
MSPEEQSAAAAKASACRVSVACLPCRNRHVRCDAQQPICVRCSSEGRTCQYVKSRRGGLDRARLAERRRFRNKAVAESPSDTSPGSRSPRQASANEDLASTKSHPTSSLDHALWSTESETSDRVRTHGTPISIPDVQLSNVTDGDPLIKSFYKHFNRCHPCVVPQNRLQQLCDSAPGQESLNLLIAVMRFIGSSYSCPDSSPQLQEKVVEGLQAIQRLAPDPFQVQCRLLYSIALFWGGEKTKSRGEIDAAISTALNLGMNRHRFAADHGRGDAVLQESLRRTWWQLYIIDAYYAAIKRSPTFSLCEVDADTELPCEEDEYESGSIPTPKTLDDFDSREFGPENQTFSSFAYLIGATRNIALALSAGLPDASNWLSPKTIAEVDAIIDGWFLLLPKSKKEVLREGSVVDELMFQAQMAVHANLIALHRPFSRLPFHPLEGISSCLVEPPARLPVKEAETVHTQRCLQSIEAQLQLLVLPVQPFRRSPFTICMTAAGTIALLSAIKAFFSGRQLAVARHQLRLVVGYLKAMAKVWPQGRRNLEEVQTIAQEVLVRKNEPRHRSASDKDIATSQQPLAADAAPSIDELENWSNPAIALETQDCLEPYWSLNHDFQPDIPVWFSTY